MLDTTQALTEQSCSAVCLGDQDTRRRMGQAALIIEGKLRNKANHHP